MPTPPRRQLVILCNEETGAFPVGNGRHYRFFHANPLTTPPPQREDIRPFPPGLPPSLSPARFQTDMLALMDQLSEANGGSPLWWATDIASRNRFESPLPKLLNAYAQALGALDMAGAEGCSLILAGLPWQVVRQVQEVALALGWSVQLPTRPKNACMEGELKAWRGLAADAWACLKRIHKRPQVPLTAGGTAGPVFLLKTFAYPSSFSGGIFTDPFFGSLAQHLKDHLPEQTRLATLFVALGDIPKEVIDMHRAVAEDLFPLEVFLRRRDVPAALLHIAAKRIFAPFAVPQVLTFLGRPASTLVHECLRSGGWRIRLYQYLHRAAGRRLAKALPVEKCLSTFEGNPWERMLLLGLREARPELKAGGYQHAVVPPAAQGVLVTNSELRHAPLPNLIFTTGDTPARILGISGAIPQERIHSACALRQTFPEPPPLQGGPFTVLVALEGVHQAIPMLRYVLAEAPSCPDALFVVRAHPALPLAAMLATLGLHGLPGGNITASGNGPLMEDVARCHAVLYWGTTMAVEALGMARAVIHFDNGQLPSFDPLHAFTGLKWTTAPARPLAPVLAAINTVPEKEWHERAAAGRKQCLDFFTPPTEERLNVFLRL